MYIKCANLFISLLNYGEAKRRVNMLDLTKQRGDRFVQSRAHQDIFEPETVLNVSGIEVEFQF